MSRPMRATSSRSASSNVSTSRALARKTGSPNLRMWRNAASRRARSSSVSAAGGAACSSTISCCSATWPRLLAAPAGQGWPAGAISEHPEKARRAWWLLGVDVHAEGRVAVRAVAGGGAHGGVDGGHGGRALARLDDDLRALAAAEAEQRRRAERVGAEALAHRGGGGVRGARALR